MIDPSFVDITDKELAEGNPFMPTPPDAAGDYHVIADLTKQLDQKIKDHEFVSAQLRRRVAQIESFEGALKNNEWDFDYETLSDLAGYFDIELSREYDVTLTVRWSGTVTAPMHFDMDDIENYLDIRIDTDYRTSDAIIDLYQDEFDIDYNEVG